MKGPEDEKTGKGGRRGSGKINWTILKEGREMFRAKLRDRETCDEATGREKRMGYVLSHTHTHTHTHLRLQVLDVDAFLEDLLYLFDRVSHAVLN